VVVMETEASSPDSTARVPSGWRLGARASLGDRTYAPNS
jgi:hypothetical protein